ncbi:uncharacterized protein SCODWIG_03592 [Saccharomycodes ludwigii]|uniref:RRM domain-containing protein n=1 Tax=Saccharomycodes ludwigii TaxID=36035 RepID=A0A376BB55_9ASCO|nr:hypothetical protein SCDLUD_004870 [Saccharomycodes ludwigii]KAH3899427.1 hypothetical protein SCDLUD_004870 [Saccharomycodes ludwigii]SSD61831.1 uncharacterized protein SCODWIG_03592 [Saccharomycodes ludwigii]
MSGINKSNNGTIQLYMGDLDPYWNEHDIRNIWKLFGEYNNNNLVNVKMIKPSTSNNPTNPYNNAGYCFLHFSNEISASNALLKNGLPIPNTKKYLKLNWASHTANNATTNVVTTNTSNINNITNNTNSTNNFTLFVGDLSPNVNEQALVDFLVKSNNLQSLLKVKVIYDPVTGVSKNYGFVTFGDINDYQICLDKVNGMFLNGRNIRVCVTGNSNNSTIANTNSRSNNKINNTINVPNHHQLIYNISALKQPSSTEYTDPNNTTVFIGGLSSLCTENELRSYFEPFGEIVYVKIPVGKGCGFVQYVERNSAEEAISKMQGYPIGSYRIRLSWGRSSSSAGNNNNSISGVTPNRHRRNNSSVSSTISNSTISSGTPQPTTPERLFYPAITNSNANNNGIPFIEQQQVGTSYSSPIRYETFLNNNGNNINSYFVEDNTMNGYSKLSPLHYMNTVGNNSINNNLSFYYCNNGGNNLNPDYNTMSGNNGANTVNNDVSNTIVKNDQHSQVYLNNISLQERLELASNGFIFA